MQEMDHPPETNPRFSHAGTVKYDTDKAEVPFPQAKKISEKILQPSEIDIAQTIASTAINVIKINILLNQNEGKVQS